MVETAGLEHEQEMWSRGLKRVAGVDEAGRGPLAGPVAAAAVILDPGRLGELPGLTDSKKLSPSRREALFPLIQSASLAWALGWASEEEIERHNILRASLLAMTRALEGLAVRPQAALVDGPHAPQAGLPCRPLVRGDALSLSIAAASVLAKVSRDRLMERHHQRYPLYGFDRHKGYGTAQHWKALREHGPCPIHRASFLRKGLAPLLDQGGAA